MRERYGEEKRDRKSEREKKRERTYGLKNEERRRIRKEENSLK